MMLNKTNAIKQRPLAILDIGSSKICCMIGEADGLGVFAFSVMAHTPLKGYEAERSAILML